MIDKEQKFIDIHPILDYGKGTGKTYVCDRLATFKKEAEKLNKIFGWNVTVDKVEIVKQEDEVIDSNVQEEINESKANENNGENVSRETTEDGETND